MKIYHYIHLIFVFSLLGTITTDHKCKIKAETVLSSLKNYPKIKWIVRQNFLGIMAQLFFIYAFNFYKILYKNKDKKDKEEVKNQTKHENIQKAFKIYNTLSTCFWCFYLIWYRNSFNFYKELY